jgi:Fic family protein
MDLETNRLPRLGSKIDKAQQLLLHLYQIPIIDSKQVVKLLNISPSTANRLISEMSELGILHEMTGYKRNRKYIFTEYFRIFNQERTDEI